MYTFTFYVIEVIDAEDDVPPLPPPVLSPCTLTAPFLWQWQQCPGSCAWFSAAALFSASKEEGQRAKKGSRKRMKKGGETKLIPKGSGSLRKWQDAE